MSKPRFITIKGEGYEQIGKSHNKSDAVILKDYWKKFKSSIRIIKNLEGHDFNGKPVAFYYVYRKI